jgi:hypothetical protein
MKEKVNKKITELIRKAKSEGHNVKPSGVVRHRSSLDRMIKTKEQADKFMKLLHS